MLWALLRDGLARAQYMTSTTHWPPPLYHIRHMDQIDVASLSEYLGPKLLQWTFRYIWTNHLSKKKKGMCTCGEKTIKRKHQKQLQHNNHNFECL